MIYKKTLPWKNLLDIPQGLIDSDKDGVFENLKLPWDGVQNKPFIPDKAGQDFSQASYYYAREIYISPTGDPDSPGTDPNYPTILSSALANTRNNEDVNFYLATGDHYLEFPIEDAFKNHLIRKNVRWWFGRWDSSASHSDVKLHPKVAELHMGLLFTVHLFYSILSIQGITIYFDPAWKGSIQPWHNGMFELTNSLCVFINGIIDIHSDGYVFAIDGASGYFHIGDSTINAHDNATLISNDYSPFLGIQHCMLTITPDSNTTLYIYGTDTHGRVLSSLAQTYTG